MVASLIFIVLLRFLAGIMVWVMIVMVILVLGYGERSGAFSVVLLFLILSGICMKRRRFIGSATPGVFHLGVNGLSGASPASRFSLFGANVAIFCFPPQESSTVTWSTPN